MAGSVSDRLVTSPLHEIPKREVPGRAPGEGEV